MRTSIVKVVVATGIDSDSLIVASGGVLYVAEPTSGVIGSISETSKSGPVASTATGQVGVQALAIDGATLYLGGQSGGVLSKMPASGGTPVTLATGLNQVHPIVTDAQNVAVATDSGVVVISPK